MAILGTYNNATWAWYNQIVEEGYAGNCVRLVRDNGDPDPANWPRQDIGFSGTGLGATIDVDAFNTFKNGGDVYADTLYGQIGGVDFLPTNGMLPFDFYTYPDTSVSELPGLISDGSSTYLSNESPAIESSNPQSRYAKVYLEYPGLVEKAFLSSANGYIRNSLAVYGSNDSNDYIKATGTSGSHQYSTFTMSAQELYGNTLGATGTGASGGSYSESKIFLGTSIASTGEVLTASGDGLNLMGDSNGTTNNNALGFMQGAIVFQGTYHTTQESEDILTQLNTLEEIKIPKVTFLDDLGNPIVGGHVLWIEETAFAADSASWNSPVIVESTGVTDANGEVSFLGTVDETKVYTAVLRDYEYVNGAWVKSQGSDTGQQNVDLTAPV